MRCGKIKFISHGFISTFIKRIDGSSLIVLWLLEISSIEKEPGFFLQWDLQNVMN